MPARNTSKAHDPAAPEVLGSPMTTDQAGSSPGDDRSVLKPRRSSTRLPAAALNQNSNGNTAHDHHQVACTRPRMMKLS
jgi:hypothetical protein